MSARTTDDQVNAAGALLALITAFPGLPAPILRLERLPRGGGSAEFVWGVSMSLHDSLGHFEQWRAVLGFDPQSVTACLDDPGTNWLESNGTWAGVPVQVIGYFKFRVPEQSR